MKNINILFDDEKFNCRIVNSNEGEELIIGSISLLNNLEKYMNSNDEFTNPEAERVYNQIFYFVADQDLKLSDKKLIKILKDENPEWFE